MSLDTDKSVILSFPSPTSSSLNSAHVQRSRIPAAIRKSWSTVTTPVKKAWLPVTFPVREIWSPLACHIGGIVGMKAIEDFRDFFPDLKPCLRGVVLHVILCFTLTILLPISLPWKLILRKRFALTWERVLVISCIAMSVDRMLIIVEGEITLTEPTFHILSRLRKRGNIERILKRGDFIGEELLTWAFPDVSISKYKPDISRKYVDCCEKVEAFALTKEGVESVVAYYREGTKNFEELENGRDDVDADSKGCGTATSPTIEQRLDQLIQLQVDMLQQHRDEMAYQGRRLNEMAAFLARLGYPNTPPPPPPPPPPQLSRTG